MSALDHVVINTMRNMDAAAECFEALGFMLNTASFIENAHTHLILAPGGAEVMLKASSGDDATDVKFLAVHLNIRVEGTGKEVIDELFAKTQAKGVKALDEPADQPWNGRTVYYDDPDGESIPR